MRDEGIEVTATRWARHAVLMLALLAVLLLTTWWSRRSAVPPLDADEFKAVVAEIDAMIKTPESKVRDFVVHAATPERIVRLYRSDAVAQLSNAQRENGLILAGQSDLLRFEAPSDIVHAIDRWFPQEMASARREKHLWQGAVHLHGPFAGWHDEPAMFVTLWNCMPQRAWLQPGGSPFDPEADDGLGYMGIVAHSSSELDFGECVRERSGRLTFYDEAQRAQVQADGQQMAARMAPLLTTYFAQYLAQRGCNGTGPDDCVLIAMLWVSLAPADARLAEALKKIEAAVAPGAAPAAPGATTSDGDARRTHLLQGMRQAAFLRAKLVSIAAAPSLWPVEAVPLALHQLAQLQAQLDLARADPQRNWSRFDLHYYNEPINPWPAVQGITAHPAGAAALKAQLKELPDSTDCQQHALWQQRIPKPLVASVALAGWSSGRPTRCLQPDWEWLRAGPAAEVGPLRAALAALVSDNSGQVHEQVLGGLTSQGADCFGDGAHDAPADLLALCRRWISRPQQVSDLQTDTHGRVQPADTFATLQLPELPAALMAESSPQAPSRHAAWLAELLRSLAAPQSDAAAVTQALGRSGQLLSAVQGWRSADGKQQLLALELMPGDASTGQRPAEMPAWPYGNYRLLLLLSPGRLQAVGVPPRFAYQYDEGSVARVTDIDRDGRPEVWLSGTFGECDGEDLQPEVDCAITTIHMGEIWGDTLSYFAWTPGGVDKLSEPRP